MAIDAKKWYLSKTVWFNVLYAIVVVAGFFGFAGFEPSPELKEVLLILGPVVNFILRLLTNKGVTL
jgi:hypothetical protein